MNRLKHKRRALWVIVAWMCGFVAASASVSYSANFDLSKMSIDTTTLDSTVYTLVSCDDCDYYTSEVGKPKLPCRYVLLSVPVNATNLSVSYTTTGSSTITLSNDVYPVPEPQLAGESIGDDWFPESDTLAVSTPAVYPEDYAWIASESYVNGENHVVAIGIVPAQYDSVSKKLLCRSTINITVSYELPDAPSYTTIARQSDDLRAEAWQSVKAMVVNPSSVEDNAELASDTFGEPEAADIDSLMLLQEDMSNNPFEYLIIADGAFTPALKRLVALKRQKGYAVKILTTASVLSLRNVLKGDQNYRNGTLVSTIDDDPGVIRAYLKKAYRYGGLKYLLLAGTSVPYRPRTLDAIYKFNFPTDWYYADLNTDWTLNANEFDYGAELAVGRILAKKNEQIHNYTNKLLRYELNPGDGNTSYLRKFLYCTEFTTDSMSRLISVMRPYYSFSTLFTALKGEDFPKGSDIVNEINRHQYGFMSFHNHGVPSSIEMCDNGFNHKYRLWAIDSVRVHDSNSRTDIDDNCGLDCIKNKNFPSIMIANSCETMPYDTIAGYGDIINMGESFTTGKDYGGPAYIGYTREIPGDHAEEIEYRFITHLPQYGYKIGTSFAFSRLYFQLEHDHYRKQTCKLSNLLGDPEFEMWTNLPASYSNVDIVREDDAITILGINKTDTVDSTIVAYCNVNTQGKIKFMHNVTLTNISPNSSIMLYQHNYLPYITPLLLQNETITGSQYVLASSVWAGNHVDGNRASGDFVVAEGADYEIEAKDDVVLDAGFSVQKGATFMVVPAEY